MPDKCSIISSIFLPVAWECRLFELSESLLFKNKQIKIMSLLPQNLDVTAWRFFFLQVIFFSLGFSRVLVLTSDSGRKAGWRAVMAAAASSLHLQPAQPELTSDQAGIGHAPSHVPLRPETGWNFPRMPQAYAGCLPGPTGSCRAPAHRRLHNQALERKLPKSQNETNKQKHSRR